MREVRAKGEGRNQQWNRKEIMRKSRFKKGKEIKKKVWDQERNERKNKMKEKLR